MKKLKIELQQKANAYEIAISAKTLISLGDLARRTLDEKARKAVIISNPKVFGLYGETARKSLAAEGFEVFVWLMKDGETHKNFRVLEQALKFLAENKLTRTDAVIALGGGVVGDLAGFAAAVYQRGVPFLQIPTTLLAMIDSSVGGKTAVNSAFGKNLIGSFHQPNGVLIDVELLKTLPHRELAAGFCEAVKHGAISGHELLTQTHNFLQKFPVKQFPKFFKSSNAEAFFDELEKFIAAQVGFKAEVVAGDELENPHRDDAKSRKILNFGHTVGHALEKVTDYKRFKHGEAVGYGILVATEISKNLVKPSKTELNYICETVRLIGELPKASDIPINEIIKAFAFDKKTSGDSLRWILLEEIGRARIIENKEIHPEIIYQSIRKVLNTRETSGL